LEHTGNDTACRLRAILQSGCCCITIKSAHGNTEEGSHGKELLVGLAETCTEFKNDEQHVVDDKGPDSGLAVTPERNMA
jgi:hypothetical protein